MMTVLRMAVFAGALMGTGVIHAHADEAPTILIEDAILNCTEDGSNASMPSVAAAAVDLRSLERSLHRQIANQCQGQTVCRVSADTLMDEDVRKSGCDDLVIVPVCAVGAFESVNPYASSEMTLLFRAGADLVINCGEIASPHF